MISTLDFLNNIKHINFGDIDGMYDPNLNDYFIDRNFWNRIVESYKFFVIGRKGTGKSALYNWIKSKSNDTGNLCHNVLFNEFPFQKLLQLKDDSFLKPNQYQTICKNMILSELTNIICADEEHITNEYFDNLDFYNKNINCSRIQDCFRQTVTYAKQVSGHLIFEPISLKNSHEYTTVFDFSEMDLSAINLKLESNIINYFKVYPGDKRFLIQVDGIDENYTQLSREAYILDDYFQFVISLLKASYNINQKLHSECNDIAKCIIYLRSDIFFSIHKIDAESARWEQQTEYLSWAIVSRNSWYNNDLRKLVNARIANSLPNYMDADSFDLIFNSNMIGLTECVGYKKYRKVTNLFEYLIIRTFHRPRDIIQFCIKIQDSVKDTGRLTWQEWKNGEREFSLWFLSEITNEISANIKEIDVLFTMLRSLGSRPLSISRFKSIYAKYEPIIGYTADKLLQYLYELAVIYNVNDKGEVFSSIRNDRSKLNPDIKISLHPGFWTGLYTSTF